MTTKTQAAVSQIDIVYEDAHMVAVNKPPWVLSVPGRTPEKQDSMFTRVQQQCGDVFVVHRLDCATSGIMVFAKSKATEKALHQRFRDRQTSKEYIAVCAGTAPLRSGKVILPLIVDWPNRPKSKVDLQQGKYSVTEYQVLEEQPATTRLRLVPITGRSHQLRLHMKYLGMPILGDKLYAPEDVIAASERMLLHAQKLQLQHPVDGATMEFFVPCPF